MIAPVSVLNDAASVERYPYLNKPNALKHFLAEMQPPITESVIALLDPDMVLLQPITPCIELPPVQSTAGSNAVKHCVEEGAPAAQVDVAYRCAATSCKWHHIAVSWVARRLGYNLVMYCRRVSAS